MRRVPSAGHRIANVNSRTVLTVPNDESIKEVLVKPKNSDMTLVLFGLVWLPYRRDARGHLAPDWV